MEVALSHEVWIMGRQEKNFEVYSRNVDVKDDSGVISGGNK